MATTGWFWYRFSQLVLVVLATYYWRIPIRGRDNIPKSGAFLLCPVHRSNVDGPITCIFLWRRMAYLAKQELFTIEWLGRVFVAMGAIPVNREAPGRETLKRCVDVLKSGKPLVLFPEGTRRDGPKVVPLLEGAAYLAHKAGVPIVPVGIGGSERVNPRGGKFLWPRKMAVVIGEPIHPDAQVLEPGAGVRRQRESAERMTQELHDQLQVLFDEAQRRAGV